MRQRHFNAAVKLSTAAPRRAAAARGAWPVRPPDQAEPGDRHGRGRLGPPLAAWPKIKCTGTTVLEPGVGSVCFFGRPARGSCDCCQMDSRSAPPRVQCCSGLEWRASTPVCRQGFRTAPSGARRFGAARGDRILRTRRRGLQRTVRLQAAHRQPIVTAPSGSSPRLVAPLICAASVSDRAVRGSTRRALRSCADIRAEILALHASGKTKPSPNRLATSRARVDAVTGTVLQAGFHEVCPGADVRVGRPSPGADVAGLGQRTTCDGSHAHMVCSE